MTVAKLDNAGAPLPCSSATGAIDCRMPGVVAASAPSIFIVGTGRCGTYMLRDVLNLHPGVFIPQETHWWALLYQEYGLTRNPIHRYLPIIEGCRYHNGTRIIDEVLRDAGVPFSELAAMIDDRAPQQPLTVAQFGTLFYALLARSNNATMSGDKTPEYGMCMQAITRLWPAARFVHVVRDGRSVARSMQTHEGFRLMAKHGITSWQTVTFSGSRTYPLQREHGRTLRRLFGVPQQSGFRIDNFIALWALRLRRIRDEMERVPREQLMEVRYEDFCSDPHALLRTIAAFAGLDCNASWLDAACANVHVRPVDHAHGDFGADVNELLRVYGYL